VSFLLVLEYSTYKNMASKEYKKEIYESMDLLFGENIKLD
jgi:hypothetical protein